MWAVVYQCLRCGDQDALANVVEKAMWVGVGGVFWKCVWVKGCFGRKVFLGEGERRVSREKCVFGRLKWLVLGVRSSLIRDMIEVLVLV